MRVFIILAALLIAVDATPLLQSYPVPQPETRKFKTTAHRIAEHGYPVETHTVQTSDAYILTLFRIPHSPKLNNQNIRSKPVIFLQHGLLSSSDCWILNGPDEALAFMLADEGYDVWMGNGRGNTYSKKHANKSPLLPPFWDFSWHEIAIYDLPAMLDYTLYTTGEHALHYVGHSQGTTVFMVMLSTMPQYNSKIKSSHMLAPVGFMENMQSPLAKIAAPLLGQPSLLADLIGNSEFMPSNKLLSMLGSQACSDESIFQNMCGNVLFLIAGWDSKHLNYSLLPDIVETHPAGCSTAQLIHYLQEKVSANFCQYDHGTILNKKKYKQKTPPHYLLENIRPVVPIEFYYSDNDYFAAVKDVLRLAAQLEDKVRLYHVKYADWNHLDFLWATDIKEIINDRVVHLTNAYEKKRKH